MYGNSNKRGGFNRPVMKTERIFLLYKGKKLRMASGHSERIRDAIKNMIISKEISYGEGEIGEFLRDWATIRLSEINDKLAQSNVSIIASTEEREQGGYRKFIYIIYDIDESDPYRGRSLTYVTSDERNVRDYISNGIYSGSIQYGEAFSARNQINEYLGDWDSLPHKMLNSKMRYAATTAIEDGKILA